MIRTPILCLALTALTLSGAPANKRRLESIKVTPASASGAKSDYSAAGVFTAAPFKVSPLRASWYLAGPGIDPPPAFYSLTAGRYKPARCNEAAANPVVFNYTVIALAPADPKAPASGPVPRKAFQDLVIDHSKASEDGFVPGTAKLVCP
jgi:hypothetical protein